MKKFISTIVLFIICILLILNNKTSDVDKISIYDKVIDNNSIDVWYIVYDKSFIIDPNTGEFSWIFYDVMQEVWNRLNIQVNYTHELGWSDMITSLKTNKVDMLVTWIWPSSSRSKHVEYIDTLYYSPVYMYTNYENNSFDTISSVNKASTKIWIIDGEMTSIIAKNNFPNAQTYSNSQLTSVDQLMLDLSTLKTDITFLESSVANSYIENNPNKIKKIHDDAPLRKFWNSMVVKKGEFELQSMINNVIIELKNEWFIDQVIMKYNAKNNFIY